MLKLLLLATNVLAAANQYHRTAEDVIRETHGDIFMGEPFLTKERQLNDLWFDLSGQILQSAWKGFLSGLYNKPQNMFICSTQSTLEAIRTIADQVESTHKEVFFLHLARSLKEL